MTTPEQDAFAAGIVLGEGCLTILFCKKKGTSYTYYIPRIQVRMGDKGTVEWLQRNYPASFSTLKPKVWNASGGYEWQLGGKKRVLPFLHKIRPYTLCSTEKLEQIDVLIEFCNLPHVSPSNKQVVVKRQAELAAKVKALKPVNLLKSNQTT